MTIRVAPRSEQEAGLWRTTLEISELLRDWPWMLIGAQAIVVLALERGRPVGRATRDIDVVVDVRVVADSTRRASDRLVDSGYEPSAEHPYRFIRGSDQVDLLAPDHLGPRADLTTIPPLATTEIPGSSRALATRRQLDLSIDQVGEGSVSVPSVAGMLVLKTKAWQARRADRDIQDIVRLLDLANDPKQLRAELKSSERRSLKAISELADEHHGAWRVATYPADARASLHRITN